MLILVSFVCTLKRPRRGILTYEGAPFGVQFSGHADAGAQVQHDEHGGDHDNALQQQQRLKVAAKSAGARQKNVWAYYKHEKK